MSYQYTIGLVLFAGTLSILSWKATGQYMATQADSDSDTQVSTSALLSSVYQASRERLFVRMLWTKQLLLPK